MKTSNIPNTCSKGSYPQGLKQTPADPEAILPDRVFINNSNYARNPPSEPYRDLLIEAGCEVAVHDPHVLEYPDVAISHELNDVVAGADVVAVLTGHDEYFELGAKALKDLMRQEQHVIVDGRNVVDADGFIGAGFVYEGLGGG